MATWYDLRTFTKASKSSVMQNFESILDGTKVFTALTVTGAISGATATDTINGVIINAGAVSGVTTLGLSSTLTAQGGAQFNAGRTDVNFLIESNNNTSMFFVDGGVDQIFIGTQTQSDLRIIAADALLGIAANSSEAGINIAEYSADANGSTMRFASSRHASIGSHTIVQDNDVLGELSFTGSDGTNFAQSGARMLVKVDGTPGANDMPTSIEFYNHPTGGTQFQSDLVLTLGQDKSATFAGAVTVGAYTLPATDGTNGQVLVTNGSGVLTWTTP